MDYAIVKTGGKQYRVSPGDVLDVEICWKPRRAAQRRLWASADLNDYLDWPYVHQVFRLDATQCSKRAW